MATGFLKSNGHAVASHDLGSRAVVHLPTVLTGPEFKLYLGFGLYFEFGQGVVDALAGPPKQKVKYPAPLISWRSYFLHHCQISYPSVHG